MLATTEAETISIVAQANVNMKPTFYGTASDYTVDRINILNFDLSKVEGKQQVWAVLGCVPRNTGRFITFYTSLLSLSLGTSCQAADVKQLKLNTEPKDAFDALTRLAALTSTSGKCKRALEALR